MAASRDDFSGMLAMGARQLALDFKPVWPVLLRAVIKHEFPNQDVADETSENFRANDGGGSVFDGHGGKGGRTTRPS